MSNAINLSHAVAAFLGDAGAAVSIVGAALHSAIGTLAQHGTRAPIDKAAAIVAAIKGTGRRDVAMREGWAAALVVVKGIKAGRHDEAGATELADKAAEAFELAAGAILNTVTVKAKADPAKVAARAFAVLKGLTDAQLTRALTGADAADVLASIARVQAGATVKATKAAPVKVTKAAPVKAGTVVAELLAA